MVRRRQRAGCLESRDSISSSLHLSRRNIYQQDTVTSSLCMPVPGGARGHKSKSRVLSAFRRSEMWGKTTGFVGSLHTLLRPSSSAEVRHLHSRLSIGSATEQTLYGRKASSAPDTGFNPSLSQNREAWKQPHLALAGKIFFTRSSQTCSVNTENQIIPCLWLLLSSTAGYASPG